MARRWAVLIDAENGGAEVADPLFARVATWGDACVRRMYGNFDGNHAAWKEAGARHSIERVHLCRLTAGKNGADIALVIDALDLMHRGHVDGFCLVSSDSDFARLAWRLRAEGKTVRGVGRASAVEAFRMACSQFVACEELIGQTEEPERRVTAQPAVFKVTVGPSGSKKDPALAIPAIETAMASMSHADGWYDLSALGITIGKVRPKFNKKTYGHAKLLKLVRATGAFVDRKVTHGAIQIAVK